MKSLFAWDSEGKLVFEVGDRREHGYNPVELLLFLTVPTEDAYKVYSIGMQHQTPCCTANCNYHKECWEAVLESDTEHKCSICSFNIKEGRLDTFYQTAEDINCRKSEMRLNM